jgi:tripartite-type tricarboxylate transporter receptor subunit TctC
MMTGADMLLVSYRGVAPALTDLLGGQVQVMFVTTVSSIEYIKTGRLRALAVTTATRSEMLPDIPTMGEFLPGYEATSWYGVGVPRNTPAEIVDKLNKEVNAALSSAPARAERISWRGHKAGPPPIGPQEGPGRVYRPARPLPRSFPGPFRGSNDF